VIGTQFGSLTHIPALQEQPGVELTAVCSAQMTRAREVAGLHGIPHVFDDYRDLMLSGEVDAVTIAAPPHLHHPMVLAACESGIHVLCEKPMARNAAEARDMLRMAREAGICHSVAFQRRFEGVRQRAKRLIDQGFIGAPHSVSVIVYRSTLAEANNRTFSWLMEQEKGGGILAAIGSHYVDLLRWWFGEIHAVCGAVATAVERRPVAGSETYRVADADDNTAFVLRFANGALGTVTISYTAAADVGEEIVASGSGGIIALQEPDQLVGGRLGGQIQNLGTVQGPDGADRPAFTQLVEQWVTAIRTGEEASPSFEDGAKVQEVTDAVTRSVQLSRWIDLSGKKWPV
jgi:predicted dehydrogenase